MSTKKLNLIGPRAAFGSEGSPGRAKKKKEIRKRSRVKVVFRNRGESRYAKSPARGKKNARSSASWDLRQLTIPMERVCPWQREKIQRAYTLVKNLMQFL